MEISLRRRPVALDEIERFFLHLVLGKAGVDLDIVKGAVESLDVLSKLEGLMPEGARHIVDRIPEDEPPVEEGDSGLTLGDDLAAQEDHQLGHGRFSLTDISHMASG